LTAGSFPAFSQIEFSLKLNFDSTKWGVFARPTENISPSQETFTGTGQVTIVVPTGFVLSGTKNFGGIWVMNSRSNSPDENPKFDYLSFGLSADNPKIIYQQGFETLLFSIDRTTVDCPDSLYLISNSDPFSAPNSVGSNPNNDILVLDSGTSATYSYSKNYDLCAWACRPCEVPEEDDDLTSTGDAKNKENFKVFPNPSSGELTIAPNSLVEKVKKVKVIDSIGRVVYQKSLRSNTINLQRLDPGVYTLQLLTKSGGVLSTKVQINK